MQLRPIRFEPDADLRAAIELLARDLPNHSGFVVSGIGSLVHAKLRLAGEREGRLVPGPLEIVSLSGSISRDGVHLHMIVADATGRCVGGHVCAGCTIRTTAELLVAELPAYALSRELDASTGFRELVVRSVG